MPAGIAFNSSEQPEGIQGAGNARVADGSQRVRLGLLGLHLIYFALLHGIYVYYLSRFWAYTGFIWAFDEQKLALSIPIFALYVYLIPVKPDARTIFLNIFASLYLAPSLVLFTMAGKPVSSVAVISFSAFLVYAVSAIRLPPLKIFEARPVELIWLLACLSWALVLFFYLFGGFRYFNLNLSRVYEFREEATEAVPLLFSYLSSIFSKIIVLFGVLAAIIYRKYLAAGVFIAASIVLFGLTSHKGIIFYPLFTVVIYYALRRSLSYAAVLRLLIAALLLCFFDAFMYNEVGDSSFWGWFASLFVRRGLMLPPLLDYFHIDFFWTNPRYFWADSKISLGLVRNPYGISSPYLIGQMYFGDPTMGANTGFIGSGFAQAGYFGSTLYSIGVGLALALINAHAKRQGVPFVTALMASQVMTMFVSSDFVTLFINHGLLFAFLLLGVIGSPEPERPTGRTLAAA